AGLSERFGGQVPRTLAELTTLPGVARKTASVVLGTAYGLAEGVVVDTHVQRLSMRLGLTRATDVKDIEKELMEVIPHAHTRREEHEEGPHEGHPARELDPVLASGDLARAPRLLRAQAELRGLHAGAVLSVGGSRGLIGVYGRKDRQSSISLPDFAGGMDVAPLPSAVRSHAWIVIWLRGRMVPVVFPRSIWYV